MCVELHVPRSDAGSMWWLYLILIYGLVHWVSRDVSQCVLNLLLGRSQIRKIGLFLERGRVLFQVILILYAVRVSLDAPQDVISGIKAAGRAGSSIKESARGVLSDASELLSQTQSIGCLQMNAPFETLNNGLPQLNNYSTHANDVDYTLGNASVYVSFWALIPYGWVLVTFIFASYAFVVQRIRYWRPSQERWFRLGPFRRQIVCCLSENPRRVLKRFVDPGAIVALMFVASKVPFAVMAQWTCWDADTRILNIINNYVSSSVFGPHPLRHLHRTEPPPWQPHFVESDLGSVHGAGRVGCVLWDMCWDWC